MTPAHLETYGCEHQPDDLAPVRGMVNGFALGLAFCGGVAGVWWAL